MNEHTKKDSAKILWILIFAILYIAVGAFSYRLYLRQAIHFEGPMGTYRADLGPHIEAGLTGDGYSLMEVLYRFLLVNLGLNEKAIAVVLALLTVGCVPLAYKFMRNLNPDSDPRLIHLLGFASLFVFAIYMPFLNPQWQMGMQNGTNWHNDTYMAMRFFAMLVILFYFAHHETYRERFTAKDFILFTVLMTVTNMIKASFLLAFAPAMGLVLLYDCIRDRGKTILRQILFGLPVLLSVPILLIQMTLLFPSGGDGSSGSMIGMSFAYIVRLYAKHPLAAVLQSTAFPLLVFLRNRKLLGKDRIFTTCWLIWLFGFIQFFFFHEEGPRKDHCNLIWGYSFCMYLVFLLCFALFSKSLHETTEKIKRGAKGAGVLTAAGELPRTEVLYYAAGIILFFAHLISGIAYFSLALQGASIRVPLP